MERKIGEIFEFGGEWYQCLKSASCDECAFLNSNCIDNPSLKCSVDDRTDNCSVIFKKLEKWRDPYPNADKLYQLYKLPMNIEKLPPHTEGINLVRFDIVEIEIKQNKEDMEDLDKIKVRDYTKVEELNVMEEKKLNLKPFDIQKAREGKPVCTRYGRKATVWTCTLENKNFPIVAIVDCEGEEYIYQYDANGVCDEHDENLDLMMLPEKRSGWAKVRKDINLYDTKEEADRKMIGNNEYVTAKVCWEE